MARLEVDAQLDLLGAQKLNFLASFQVISSRTKALHERVDALWLGSGEGVEFVLPVQILFERKSLEELGLATQDSKLVVESGQIRTGAVAFLLDRDNIVLFLPLEQLFLRLA